MFCNVVHILLSEHLREGYDLNIILYRIVVQQFFTISYHRLVCYGCGLGYSLVKEVLCCSCCIYMYLIFIKVYSLCTCGWYLESLQFTHVWMVQRVDRVLTCGWYLESLQFIHVWMVQRVDSVLTCGWYLESWQFTHVWMVLRGLIVYSRVDGT